MTVCPCGTGRSLDECCGPIVNGASALTAEALMRARYTAFVSGHPGDFALESLAPEKRAEFDAKEVANSAKGLEPLGIEVLASSDGGEEDETGTIEYVARFRVKGHGQPQTHDHHELASFRKEDGRWLYVDGQMNPKKEPRQVVRIGRNDPCPCGSGKKYKKCCGA